MFWKKRLLKEVNEEEDLIRNEKILIGRNGNVFEFDYEFDFIGTGR